jgi:hypothetical protein
MNRLWSNGMGNLLSWIWQEAREQLCTFKIKEDSLKAKTSIDHSWLWDSA